MRVAEFDREHVLEQAMQAFQHNGYSKTTMQQLTAATGLHPGSIYCAFGNKRGLLLAAVEHYVQAKAKKRDGCFRGLTPLAGLEAYLLQVVDDALQARCLVSRTLMELAEHDEQVAASLNEVFLGTVNDMMTAIEQAKAQHELPSHANSQELAYFLMMAIQGMVAMGQCKASNTHLKPAVTRLIRALSQ